MDFKEHDWKNLTKEERNRQLYFKQKRLLDTFLSHHAISQAQYEKSLGDLKIKMNIEGYLLKD